MLSSWPGSAPVCRPKPGPRLHAVGVGQEAEVDVAPTAPVRGLLISQRSLHGKGVHCRPSPGHTPAWWAPCLLESHQHPRPCSQSNVQSLYLGQLRTWVSPGEPLLQQLASPPNPHSERSPSATTATQNQPDCQRRVCGVTISITCSHVLINCYLRGVS